MNTLRSTDTGYWPGPVDRWVLASTVVVADGDEVTTTPSTTSKQKYLISPTDSDLGATSERGVIVDDVVDV
jgi:hypothetical protein